MRDLVLLVALVAGGFAAMRILWLEGVLAQKRADLDRETNEKLEQLRGSICTDLERDLRFRENRMRIAAEIELRLYDREWQIADQIGDVFSQAAREFDRAFMHFVAADQNGSMLIDFKAANPEHGLRLLDLKALLARVPSPQREMWILAVKILEEVSDSISEELEKHQRGATKTVTREWCAENEKRLKSAHNTCYSLQLTWRARLRVDSQFLLEGLRRAPNPQA